MLRPYRGYSTISGILGLALVLQLSRQVHHTQADDLFFALGGRSLKGGIGNTYSTADNTHLSHVFLS